MSCTTPQGRLELALDLSSGKTLTLVEQGKGYLRLRDEFGLSVDEIANKRGKSKQHINNCIQLVTQTDDDVLEMVNKGEISATTVIETYQSEDSPEQAKTVISEAVDLAKSKGKTRATAKDVEAVKGGDTAKSDSTPKTTKSSKVKDNSDDTTIDKKQEVVLSEDKFDGWDDNETTESTSEEIQNLATFLGSTTSEDWIHLDVETLQQIVSMIS
jgi:ParB-like chromosome segregation protein Spo0J